MTRTTNRDRVASERLPARLCTGGPDVPNDGLSEERRMAKKASQTPIETELRAILNAIAAPADVQIELYGDACVAHALSGRYEYGSGRMLRSRTRKPTAECRKALEDLAARFAMTDNDPAHKCYDEAYIEGSPLWSDVRESAARALRAFGWPQETPLREAVIKTVEPHMQDVPRSRRVRPHWVKGWSGTDTTLKYHRALFEMLDIEPVVSKPFEQIVAEREHALGRALPPSIAEFLRLRGIFDLFEQNSNADSLIGGVYRGDDRTKLRALGNPRHVAQGYLQVAVENQGVVTWFARLDGSDDPPVFHDNDMSATDDDDLSEVIWTLVAPTFSTFLFEMMSLWRFRAPQYELAVRATASRPTEQDRQRLRSLLRVGPCDERDGVFIDRFFTPHGLLKVSNSEPVEGGQAVWHIQADSPDVLDTFLAVLAPIGTLTRHFELEVWPESLRAEAQARLDRFCAG
jgi:hypothetical protein